MANLPEPTNPNPRARTLVPAGGQPLALAEHVRIAGATVSGGHNDLQHHIDRMRDREGMRFRGEWVAVGASEAYFPGDAVVRHDILYVNNSAGGLTSDIPGTAITWTQVSPDAISPQVFWRGAWVATRTYDEHQLVIFSGHLYRCTNPRLHGDASRANPPSDPTNWAAIDEWRAAWASGNTYPAGAIVTNGGNIWLATELVADTVGEPHTSTLWVQINDSVIWMGAWNDITEGDPVPRGSIVTDGESAVFYIARTTHDRQRSGPDVDSVNWTAVTSWAGNWISGRWWARGIAVRHAGAVWFANESVLPPDPAPDHADNTKWVKAGLTTSERAALPTGSPANKVWKTDAAGVWGARDDDYRSDQSIDNRIAIEAQEGNTNRWPPNKLGSGTADVTRFLRGDGAWVVGGVNGWSPVLSVVSDGSRRVLRLTSWTGGEGTAPAIPGNNYITSSGLGTLSNAIDIRGTAGAPGSDGVAGADGSDGARGADGAPGSQGDDGWAPVLSVVTDGARRVLRLTSWTGGEGSAPAVPANNYVTASGLGTLAERHRHPWCRRGADGADGAAGSSGADGADGTNGSDGAPGSDGADGAPGSDGADGTDGNDGWSPVSVSRNGRYPPGTPADWLDGWRGRGARHPRGNNYVGPSGLVSSAAAAIDIRGATGQTGQTGNRGDQGATGRYDVEIFQNAATTPATPTGGSVVVTTGAVTTPSGWSVVPTTPPSGQHTYASRATINPASQSGTVTPAWSAAFRAGSTGPAGTAGTDGNDGWAPVLSVVTDGTRRVLRLTSWTGGEGSAPAVPANNYITASGLGMLSNAIDIRGAAGVDGAAGSDGADGAAGSDGSSGADGADGADGQDGDDGDSGWSPVLSVVTDGTRRVLRLTSWTGGEGTAPAIPGNNYVTASGLGTLANAIDIRGAAGAAGADGAAGSDGSPGPPGDVSGVVAQWAKATGATGTAPPARLGTGTPSAERFLRGDSTWSQPAYLFRGDWVDGTDYMRGELVYQASRLWICEIDNNGTLSPGQDPGSWDPVSGWRGQWSGQNTAYHEGDIVTRAGSVYLVTHGVANDHVTPPEDAPSHYLLLDRPQSGVVAVGTVEYPAAVSGQFVAASTTPIQWDNVETNAQLAVFRANVGSSSTYAEDFGRYVWQQRPPLGRKSAGSTGGYQPIVVVAQLSNYPTPHTEELHYFAYASETQGRQLLWRSNGQAAAFRFVKFL